MRRPFFVLTERLVRLTVEERQRRADEREKRFELVAELIAKRTSVPEIRRQVLGRFSLATRAIVDGDIGRVNAEMKRRGLLRDASAARELDLAEIDAHLAKIATELEALDVRATTYDTARKVLAYDLDAATSGLATAIRAGKEKDIPEKRVAHAEAIAALEPVEEQLHAITEERVDLREQARKFFERRAEILGYDARRELEEGVPALEEEAAREIGIDPREFRRANAANAGKLLRFASPGVAN